MEWEKFDKCLISQNQNYIVQSTSKPYQKAFLIYYERKKSVCLTIKGKWVSLGIFLFSINSLIKDGTLKQPPGIAGTESSTVGNYEARWMTLTFL